MALSDRAIKNLKPTDKHQFVADGAGLYLRVHPTGTKTFVLRSRRNGKARWISLGEYPTMSLLEARKAALGASGKELPGKRTVQQAYDLWIKQVRKTYKSPGQVEWRAGKYVLPALGGKQLASIRRADLADLLSTVAEKAPVSANRVLTDLKLLFSYSVERGWIEDSPAAALTQKAAGGREESRSRVLSDDELGRFISLLRSDRFADKTRLALALALLTGQRSGEVRGLTDLEIKNNTWELPAQRAKNGVACVVTLTPVVTLTLRYAFKFGAKPFDGMEGQVLSRAMARMKFEPNATPHDLRRTMATWMADNGVLPHVVEKCLNHKMAGVMAIYNRAEYTAEKAAAWRAWHRHLLRLAKRSPQE